MVLLVALLGVTGCAKKNIIPDNTLADIFHDAFVVNAYIGEEHINLDRKSTRLNSSHAL